MVNLFKITAVVPVVLMLFGCQQSSSVKKDDTDSVKETDSDSDTSSETGSNSDTGTAVDTETDTDSATATDDTDTTDDTTTLGFTPGAWRVESIMRSGVEVQLDDQYAFSWDEGGETVPMNVAIFVETDDVDSFAIFGMCYVYTCDGNATFNNGEVDIEIVEKPISSVVIPPEDCPEACQSVIEDYVAVMNAVTAFQMDGEELVFFIDDHSDEIRFVHSSMTLDDLPFHSF